LLSSISNCGTLAIAASRFVMSLGKPIFGSGRQHFQYDFSGARLGIWIRSVCLMLRSTLPSGGHELAA
jgi:hypothetical protein